MFHWATVRRHYCWVATDRISAFDVVLPDGLPGKRCSADPAESVLVQSAGSVVDNHLLSTEVADVPGLTAKERSLLAGRIMLCRRSDVIPVECIARGYLSGSGYKDYLGSGAVCGHALPQGLRNGDRLPTPLFTPSTKAATGHDENISRARAAELVGTSTAEWLETMTLTVYERGRGHAERCGIILADTKLEFGKLAGRTSPLLIDEVLTRTAPASGLPMTGSRAVSNRASTSRSFAIISKQKWAQDAGIGKPPGLLCPRRC